MNRDRFKAALKDGMAKAEAWKGLVNDMHVYHNEMSWACCAITDQKKTIVVARLAELTWSVEVENDSVLIKPHKRQLLCTITGTYPHGYPVQISFPPAYGSFTTEPIADSGGLGVALEEILAMRETAALIRMV